MTDTCLKTLCDSAAVSEPDTLSESPEQIHPSISDFNFVASACFPLYGESDPDFARTVAAVVQVQRGVRGYLTRKKRLVTRNKHVIWWKGQGKSIKLAGNWTEPPWKQLFDMSFESVGGFFYAKGVRLGAGTHEFKFIVDGKWECSAHYPVLADSQGNCNNYVSIPAPVSPTPVTCMAYKLLHIRQLAAVCIQKYVRGYLLRKQLPFHRFRNTNRLLRWDKPATTVSVRGAFTSPPWTKPIMLTYSKLMGGFVSGALMKLKLPAGAYQFKFIVDGVWTCSSLYPRVRDYRENENNCMLVVKHKRTLPRAISTKQLTHEAVSNDFAAQECMKTPEKMLRTWSASFDSPLRKDIRDMLQVPYSTVKLLFGGHMVAHPTLKDAPLTSEGSADAYFIENEAQCFGIADGVGEWTTFGLNAGLFPTELMMGSRHILKRKVDNLPSDSSDVIDEMVSALNDAEGLTSSFGSSTALLGLCKDGTLHVVYIGDSSFMVIRRRENGLATVYRSVEQQHCFNCPFQLARLPGPEHYAGLVERGLNSLVSMIQKSTNKRRDTALDARTEVIRLQEGDVLVAGSDGLFDNLYDADIIEIVRNTLELDISENSLPEVIARELSMKAVEKGWDPMYKSPFARTSHKAGRQYQGGKLDDTTVVVGLAVPS